MMTYGHIDHYQTVERHQGLSVSVFTHSKASMSF